jgi:hypothetical protein
MTRGGKGGKRLSYGSKRIVTTQGYVAIYEPAHPLAYADGYVLEHRKVAWESGMMASPDQEVVHHRNEDKADNAPANLVVETASSHQVNHHSTPGSLRHNQFGAWPIVDLASGKRVCRDCGMEKPFSEFTSKHGRPACYCKPCSCIRAKRYHR